MGGFRFNGCGVTDHFKKIKPLGQHLCPNCKKIAEFALEEANTKIDIVYIPTFTLKSRYAIMCSKCKEGKLCSAEWAGYLLQQTSTPMVIFEQEAKQKGWDPQTGQFRQAADKAPMADPTLEPSPQVSVEEHTDAPSPQPPKTDSVFHYQPIKPVFCKCPACGVTQLQDGDFCAHCGQPLRAAHDSETDKLQTQPRASTADASVIQNQREKQASPVTRENVCPECGMPITSSKKFCLNCGRKL